MPWIYSRTLSSSLVSVPREGEELVDPPRLTRKMQVSVSCTPIDAVFHDGGADQPLVAEQRLAGEHGQDLGGDAEERQRHDIDLRMAEEPEQVLPQNRPATRGRKKLRAEITTG